LLPIIRYEQKRISYPEWTEKVSKGNRNADKILVEKVILALMLLEVLSNSGLPFIFKGGATLILLLSFGKLLAKTKMVTEVTILSA
jgi:hypothetical protein